MNIDILSSKEHIHITNNKYKTQLEIFVSCESIFTLKSQVKFWILEKNPEIKGFCELLDDTFKVDSAW